MSFFDRPRDPFSFQLPAPTGWDGKPLRRDPIVNPPYALLFGGGDANGQMSDSLPQGSNPFGQDDGGGYLEIQLDPPPAPQQAKPPSPQGFTPTPMPLGDADIPSSQVTPMGQKVHDLVQSLYASGASADAIRAKVRALGVDPGQALQGLDAAIAFRDGQHKLAPVEFGAPPAVHGEDKGRLDAIGQGALDSTSVGLGDELTGALGATRNQIDKALGPGYLDVVNALRGTVGLDPLSTGNGFADKRSFADEYAALRDRQRQDLADAEHNHPYYTTAGQIGGALILPSAGLASEAGALTNALRLGAEGAAYGGAYGFNSTNGGVGDRLVGGAKGAALGAALGAPLGAVGGRIAVTREGSQAIMDAADRLNAGIPKSDQVRPLPGHLGGIAAIGHALQEPSVIGGKLSGLSGRVSAFRENIGTALDRVSSDIASGGVGDTGKIVADLDSAASRVKDPEVQGSMAHFAENFHTIARDEYNQAATLAGDTRHATPRTIAAIGDLLKKWRAVPGGVTGDAELASLRKALSKGTWTVDGLRRLRTEAGRALEASSPEAREEARTLWHALSADVTNGLKAAGKQEAADAYRHADLRYAQNVRRLEQVRNIIGKDGMRSSDEIATRLARMGKGDVLHLKMALDAMSPELRGETTASILKNLGKAKAGEEGDFSLETFGTNWRKMGEEARRTLFPARRHRADLDAIAELASADRRVNKLGNPSRTAVYINNISEFGALAGAVFAPGAVLSGIIGRWGGGLLLAQPGVARAIVKLTNSGKIAGVARALTRAARMTPAYADRILGFRDELTGVGIDPKIADPGNPLSHGPAQPDASNPFGHDQSGDYIEIAP